MTTPYSPTGYPLPPAKPRPKVRWFVIGGLLVALAIACFVVGLFLTLRSAIGADATFRADGQPHTVHVPAGEKRMLFATEGDGVACVITEDGQRVPLGSPHLRTHVDANGTDWTGRGTFTSRTGTVQATCATPAVTGHQARIRIGAPLGAGFVIRVVATILVPILLGLAGVVILVVTAVLWATRRPTPSVP